MDKIKEEACRKLSAEFKAPIEKSKDDKGISDSGGSVSTGVKGDTGLAAPYEKR
jgi:hypothetical protein